LVSWWQFWYIFSRFGFLYQEKSGNPGGGQEKLEKGAEEQGDQIGRFFANWATFKGRWRFFEK
jgi:hypothetical protein